MTADLVAAIEAVRTEAPPDANDQIAMLVLADIARITDPTELLMEQASIIAPRMACLEGDGISANLPHIRQELVNEACQVIAVWADALRTLAHEATPEAA